MDPLYNAIISILNNLFSSSYPNYVNSDGNTINPIFRGYDNKMLPPKNNNYVVIYSPQDHNMSLGWHPDYDSTTNMTTYNSLMSTTFHIDFYGDDAQANARTFNNVCQNSYANTYWEINQFPCTVHKVKNPRDMTGLFGRDMYNKRFIVELEIFNVTSQQLGIPYFIDFNVTPKWVNNS